MPEPIPPAAPLPSEPLRFAYIYQSGTGMISRFRVWNECLSKGGTRAVEGELIAMDGDTSVLSYAADCEWDMLIYEPPGWTASGVKS